MRLDGKLSGPYVDEFRKAWRALAPLAIGKQISLDLRGLLFIDEQGAQALREFQNATQAVLLADSPLTKHFAELAAQGHSKS